MTPQTAILIAGGIAAYVLFLVALIGWSVKRTAKMSAQRTDALRAALVALGAVRVGERPAPEGRLRGVETEYEVRGRRMFTNAYYVDRSRVRVNLRIGGAEFPGVVIHPESSFDRFGKQIGLNREVQTGDEEFDKQAYIETRGDDEALVKRLLGASEVRQEIRQLLSMGYQVQFSVRGIEAFQVLAFGKDLDATRAEQVAGALGRIADKVPRFTDEKFDPRQQRSWLGVPLMLPALIGAAGGGGLAIFARGLLDDSSAAVAVVVYGGLAWAVYVVALSLWARGRSYALRLVLMGSLFAFVGIPVFVGMGLVALNQILDQSPAEEHVAVVRRLHMRKSNYWVHVDSWRRPGGDQLLSTSPMVYQTLKVGDRIPVKVHAGRLGWPWAEKLAGKLP